METDDESEAEAARVEIRDIRGDAEDHESSIGVSVTTESGAQATAWLTAVEAEELSRALGEIVVRFKS